MMEDNYAFLNLLHGFLQNSMIFFLVNHFDRKVTEILFQVSISFEFKDVNLLNWSAAMFSVPSYLTF